MKKEYSSKILIEFDMLFDTDAGVIRTVDEKYCDESIFFKEITELDDNLLAGLLKERTMINPLQIAFRDESDTKLMDSLYNQLMEKDYEDIVDNIEAFNPNSSRADSNLFLASIASSGSSLFIKSDLT